MNEERKERERKEKEEKRKKEEEEKLKAEMQKELDKFWKAVKVKIQFKHDFTPSPICIHLHFSRNRIFLPVFYFGDLFLMLTID